MDLDAVRLAEAVVARDWTWSPGEIAAALAGLGFGPARSIPDAFEHVGPTGSVATARLGDDGADPGRVESVCVVLAEGDDAEASFEATEASLRAKLGPEAFRGQPSDGREWGSWADLVTLWETATALVMLQYRQDDTELPPVVALVWTPPGTFAYERPRPPTPRPPARQDPDGTLGPGSRLRIATRNGRVHEGPPLEIVRSMQQHPTSDARLTVPQYVAAVVASALRSEDLELRVTGDDDEALSTSLVQELLRTGAARRA